MKKSSFLLLALVACMCLTSCHRCKLSVSPMEHITFEAGAGSKTLTVKSNCDWYASAAQDWITPTPNSGSDNGTIVLKVNENLNVSERTGTLEIFSDCGEVNLIMTITQKGAVGHVDTDLNSLQFAGKEDAEQSLSIIANSSWTISSKPDWIDVSSTHGKGNSTIKLTTNSRNNSSKERTSELIISCDGNSVVVNLVQKGLLAPNCEVTPTNIFTLNDGVAFDFKFGSEVSYYYYGYLEASSLGSMTDDEIVEVSEELFDRYTPEDDHLGVLADLYSGTEYYIICIGYNSEGKRGDMIKTKVKTKSSYSNYAFAAISDVYYTETTWNWTTTIGAYAKKYYQVAWSGLDAWYYGEFYADVEIAWIIDNNVKKGNLSPIVNSSEWSISRPAGDVDVYIATLAVGEDGEYPGVMNVFYGSISESNYIQMKSFEKPKQKCFVVSKSKLNKLVEESIIKKVK